MSNSDFSFHSRITLSFFACLIGIAFTAASAAAPAEFQITDYNKDLDVLSVRLEGSIYSDLKSRADLITVDFPLSPSNSVSLQLDELVITTPQTKFVIGSSSGDIETSPPDVILLRGEVSGQANSSAFLALSSSGMGNGLVTLETGQTYILSKTPGESAKGWNGSFTIHRQLGDIGLPDGVEFCRMVYPPGYKPPGPQKDGRDFAGGPDLMKVALDADHYYYEIFGSVGEAQSYVMMVFGAIAAIYERDLDMRMVLDYLRIWPNADEPFSADDLYGFASYWHENESYWEYNVVHMLSGRRNLDYGGVGYIYNLCDAYWAYSIGGYLNGSFGDPLGGPAIGNWDIVVTAHEIGHNAGAHHTHDQEPPVDQCPDGVAARSTIMSYCHTLVGGLSNTELRFHSVTQNEIRNAMNATYCADFDCNGNGIPDYDDIVGGFSDDVNGNDIPDECEDCNSNGILDPDDIAGPETDLNSNGIPDVCEADCNSNLLPDDWEIWNDYETDLNGNYVIDYCEPDCNENSVPDFQEIDLGMADDFDRNNVPDDCQDCNENGISDWLDLGRQGNVFVADLGGYIREFHGLSGFPIMNYTSSYISQPYDIVAGPDRALYVADIATDLVVKIDAETANITEFTQTGDLTNPSSLIFGPDENLYVTCQGDNSIVKVDGSSGSIIATFVSSGSGGLSSPHGITFGPNGNIFVTNGDNSVLEFSGTDGSFIGVFVTSGSGGLSSPRGLTFNYEGDLLVASYGTNQILKYDGNTGDFIGPFSATTTTQVWGLRQGANGHVFAAEHSSTNVPYIYDFFPNGLKFLNYIRGANSGMTNPTAFAFMPPSPSDCNQNGVLDVCDIAAGILTDADMDNIPDECVTGDSDGDGYADGIDNCPSDPNSSQHDQDDDGIGDACDNCVFTSNQNQADGDGDDVGDLCDNCVSESNPDQADGDSDFLGDACDDCTDSDGDGYGDPGYPNNTCSDDNCPTVYNPYQEDMDGDGIGDACNFLFFTYDTVQTGCTRLIVGNHGNVGNDGNDTQENYGGANLDYAEFGDCDPGARVYLFTGSPVIGYPDGGPGYADHAMYDQKSRTFKVVFDGHAAEPTVTQNGYDIYRTGTFATSNFDIGVDRTYYAPKSADSCNFIIQRTRVYSYDGMTHTNLTIGEVIDWDTPSDGPAENSYGKDESRKLIYQRGAEYNSDPGECQDNDRRFGGLALIGSYLNDPENLDTTTMPAGGRPVLAQDYVWPSGGFIPEELYSLMQVSGFSTTTAVADLVSLMSYFNGYTVQAGDTLYIYSVLSTVQDGTLGDLQNSVDKAKAWFVSNIMGGSYLIGDANSDGQVNVSDAVYIINYVFVGGNPPNPLAAGDCNCDSAVNVSDAVWIINYVFVGGAAPGDC